MLIDREEYDISDIIISLGSLMRYCIEDENAFVPLDREVEYVISYLKIQKNRLEDKLEYQVQVDDRLRQEKVPKLILQPMVENAITHGIEPRKQKGKVSILIRDAGTNTGYSGGRRDRDDAGTAEPPEGGTAGPGEGRTHRNRTPQCGQAHPASLWGAVPHPD